MRSSTILVQKMTEYTQKIIKNIDNTITTIMSLIFMNKHGLPTQTAVNVRHSGCIT